jgi:hypothetical protein
VIIFGIDPAGAGKATPQIGKRLADLGRNFQSSEQTRHQRDSRCWGMILGTILPCNKPGDESPITNF